MTANDEDDFDRLRAAIDQLRAEIKKLVMPAITPILEALNRFAVWIGL